MSDPKERFKAALAADNQFRSLLELAKLLKDEGVTKDQSLALFDHFRGQLAKEEPEPPEYDAILDVMDFIVGWCSPGSELYGDDD